MKTYMLASAVALYTPRLLGAGPDLVVNGSQTVPGGLYGTIVVKNDGLLRMNGDVVADTVICQWGTIEVEGRLTVSGDLTILGNPNGQMTVRGSNNSCHRIEVQAGVLNLCGNWSTDQMVVRAGARVQVIPFSRTIPLSGRFEVKCGTFSLESAALLDATACGSDSRGQGGGSGPGGGGYGGAGGKAFWGDSVGGRVYGDAHSLSIQMGSAGGSLGGGSIAVLADEELMVSGEIRASGGRTAGGGGSGGGVLLYGQLVNIRGKISANGGNGVDGEYHGGGGGGRIKVFYSTGVDSAELSKLSVQGGQGGWRAVSGGAGTVWVDAIPLAPALIAPSDGVVILEGKPVLRFRVLDTSNQTDNRPDDLCGVIEISTNRFASVLRRYSQAITLSGWSSVSYRSGDEAQFSVQEQLPPGSYQWRAIVQDRSVPGPNSEVRSFSVAEPLKINHVRALGNDVQIEWSGGSAPYQLQKRTTLTTGEWTKVGEDTSSRSAKDSADASTGFYRVVCFQQN
ncbi:MAG: hypothetical protein L0Z50_19245 [Verrucomicrobiales bacterium]|nr:hypothetical protein [Verrucomicrobiales bacterium]